MNNYSLFIDEAAPNEFNLLNLDTGLLIDLHTPKEPKEDEYLIRHHGDKVVTIILRTTSKEEAIQHFSALCAKVGAVMNLPGVSEDLDHSSLTAWDYGRYIRKAIIELDLNEEKTN